jgi:hypothetical protein
VFPSDYSPEAAQYKVAEVAKRGSAIVKTGINSEDIAQTYVSKLSRWVPAEHWRIVGGDLEEGFQDFNKVEPYAVCLAGKPVKKFDYYEDARRFHDNWKKKLYREGDKAKADKITLMPLNLDEEDQKPYNPNEFRPVGPITILPPKKLKSGETHQGINDYWKAHGQAPIYKTNEGDQIRLGDVQPGTAGYDAWRKSTHKTVKPGEKVATPDTDKQVQAGADKQHLLPRVVPESLRDPWKEKHFGPTKVVQKVFKLKADNGKSYNIKAATEQQAKETFQKHAPNANILSIKFVSNVMNEDDPNGGATVAIGEPAGAFAEAQTDYQKRRQRERDVDAGKPVSKPRQPKMTDYQKRRAQDRKDMELGEESYAKVMESQGITDAKLLAVARRIDLFAKTIK